MAGYELELAAWLRERSRRTGHEHSAVTVGIGDDMAVVDASCTSRPGQLLISSDMLLDGVHFDTNAVALPRIGRKAIACALSDCAAMAVRPLAVTVSLALPKAWKLGDAQKLFEGMFAIAEEFEVAIVGGDTTRWVHPLAIDIAITAVPYEGIEPVLRCGAKSGDTLYVTGVLGGSLFARHLDFTPRVREARILAGQMGGRLHAMIDISDGLALDLWRICEASGVGATLDEGLLEAVISDDAKRTATADVPGSATSLERALGDGEDFELLLAVDGQVEDIPVPLHPIGEVTQSGLRLRRPNGRVDPLEPKGYVH